MGRFMWFDNTGNSIMGRFWIGRLGLAFLAIFTRHFVPMWWFGLAFRQCQAKPAHLIWTCPPLTTANGNNSRTGHVRLLQLEEIELRGRVDWPGSCFICFTLNANRACLIETPPDWNPKGLESLSISICYVCYICASLNLSEDWNTCSVAMKLVVTDQ